MDMLFQFIANGLVSGSFYALSALGLTLIFGIMGIINLAHGAMYMIGAYLAFDLTQRLGNFWLAILIAVGLCVQARMAAAETRETRVFLSFPRARTVRSRATIVGARW